MKRVTSDAEDVTHIPAARTQNNNTASTKSTFNDSASDSSGDEEEDETWMLSRELALFINPDQADLTASLIIYGLYTWQVGKRNPFGYNPTINGKSCSYRSVRKLETEYPWLRYNSILKALRRAEIALKGDFIMSVVKRKGQKLLHFLLSDKLIKKYKFDLSVPYLKDGPKGRQTVRYWKRRKSGLISFQRNDAIKYGLLEAILISNLHHVLDPDHNVDPLLDKAGNIYRELSPVALTKAVQDKDGDIQAPLPVSSDTVTRALSRLKDGAKAAVFFEHPLQNNFYTMVSTMTPLKVDAAEVNTTAAEVNTHAAEVNSKTEVVDCNAYVTSNLQSKVETPDSNKDGNADGKCVLQPTSSLRSDVACEDEQMSAGAKKLMELVNEGLSAFRQRDKASVPKFNIKDHAVYRVDDYDKVTLIGYEFDHEFVRADWQTGKPYTRELEIDNYVAECETLFGIKELSYFKQDKEELRALFTTHLKFTPEIVNDLITHDYFGSFPAKPKKGHDFDFFARKLNTVSYFLRYLPQLIREKHLNRLKTFEWNYHPVTNAPMFDYSEMEPWLMKMAFADGKVPVTWFCVPLREERAEVGCYLEGGKVYEFLTGETITVETTHAKPIYCEEFISSEYDPIAYDCTQEPGFMRYEEFLALPLFWEEKPEPKDFSSVAIRDWKRKHGHPQSL